MKNHPRFGEWFEDILNCELVIWLERPDGANIVCVALRGGVYCAIEETPDIRVGQSQSIRKTPIVAKRKTSNGSCNFL